MSHRERGQGSYRPRSRSPRREDLDTRHEPRHDHRRRHRSPMDDRRRPPSSSHRGRREKEERPRNDSRRHHSPHKQSHHQEDVRASSSAAELPFSARYLHKGDLAKFKPLFAYFLSVQKMVELDDLDDREARGRWKSFVGKWNRGELAEGWYDPDLFSRVREMAPDSGVEPEASEPPGRPSPEADVPKHGDREAQSPPDSDDDEDYGPTLPTSERSGARMGPGIPSFQDLSLRNEMIEEDRRQAREDSVKELRAARKADRAEQKERLDEILPRADAGTRERKLEKRQAVNDKMREFRDKSPGMDGGDEKELMGGGDSLDEYKKMKAKEQRKKSERETRREEFERAKREEIEAKRKAWQEREEGTMSMLRDLAKQRFG